MLLAINDYDSFLVDFLSLLRAIVRVPIKLFETLFNMEYFSLNLGKLIFAFIFLSIIFTVIYNVLLGRR